MLLPFRPVHAQEETDRAAGTGASADGMTGRRGLSNAFKLGATSQQGRTEKRPLCVTPIRIMKECCRLPHYCVKAADCGFPRPIDPHFHRAAIRSNVLVGHCSSGRMSAACGSTPHGKPEHFEMKINSIGRRRWEMECFSLLRCFADHRAAFVRWFRATLRASPCDPSGPRVDGTKPSASAARQPFYGEQ